MITLALSCPPLGLTIEKDPAGQRPVNLRGVLSRTEAVRRHPHSERGAYPKPGRMVSVVLDGVEDLAGKAG